MNKGVIVVLILILAGLGVVVVNNQNQKAAQIEQDQINAAQEAKVEAAQKAKQIALEKARKAQAEAEKARQIALEEAKKAEQIAKQKAQDLKLKISGLIVQAKALLADGNYQEAVTMAKSIISQDAQNAEAKSILETATAKLKEVAEQKAASLIKEDPTKALDAVGSSLPKLGQ